jgi:heme/copper-type cytochrome/quinol oxidase subunit 2
MIELLYIAIPIAIVAVIAILSFFIESRPKSVEDSVSSFYRSRNALAKRTQQVGAKEKR